MSARAKTVLSVSFIALLAGGTTALLARAAATRRLRDQPVLVAQTSANSRTVPRKRNLSLQPEAWKLARQLGARFLGDRNTTSVLVGTITIASEPRSMQLVRKQTEDGESVEIRVAGSPALSWDAKQGALAFGQQAVGNERELIERLVFDSPDQFVLMQFRSASYYTVARAVRPVDAPDGYDGPLWTIVRVNDPEVDEARRPASRWRLYYLNTTTGLIDRIESEVNGQRILAEFTRWTEMNGEKVSTEIVWSSQGRILMEYRLAAFSHTQQ